MVTWLKIFKPNDSTKKLSQMVLSQVTGNLLSEVEQEQRRSGNGDREACKTGTLFDL